MVDKIGRTERLELVDRGGRIRAVLACEEDCALPSFAFLDADGETLRRSTRRGGPMRRVTPILPLVTPR